MKKTLQFLAVGSIFLLVFFGCSANSTLDDTGDTGGSTTTMPASMTDGQKVATDDSVNLLSALGNVVVVKAGQYNSTTSTPEELTVGDTAVSANVKTVTPISNSVAGSPVSAAVDALTPVETLEVEFSESSPITGTATVKIYEDESWALTGNLEFEASNVDGTTSRVPVEYEDTLVDKAGEIASGLVTVDEKPLDNKIVGALKKFIIASIKIDEAMGNQQAVTIDAKDTVETTFSDFPDDGEAIEDETIEGHDETAGEDRYTASNKFHKKYQTPGKSGKVREKITMKTHMDDQGTLSSDESYKLDIEMGQDTTFETTYEAGGGRKDTISFTNVMNGTITVGDIEIVFTDMKLALGSTDINSESDGKDFGKMRWTGSITVDGVVIDLSSMSMHSLSKIFGGMETGETGGNNGPIPSAAWDALSDAQKNIAQQAKILLSEIKMILEDETDIRDKITSGTVTRTLTVDTVTLSINRDDQQSIDIVGTADYQTVTMNVKTGETDSGDLIYLISGTANFIYGDDVDTEHTVGFGLQPTGRDDTSEPVVLANSIFSGSLSLSPTGQGQGLPKVIDVADIPDV